MKQFYKIFSDEKMSPLATQLSWSHYVELLGLKDVDKISYYIDKNIKNINQDKTIGIIICKKGNEFVMEYCSDDRIFDTIYTLN